MNSSQVLLAKSILQALIKDTDLEDPYHGEKVFVCFEWENLPKGLPNYAVHLIARQQLMRRIHHLQEETAELGIVMWIYNPVSQQEEQEMDRRLAEAVVTLEIVPAKNHAIE